jgi:hypothetical protein
MARVELYPPFTKIILWTWTELPAVMRIGSALPNVVMERHVVGCNPLQLRAAFEHLRALAHQQDREPHDAGGDVAGPSSYLQFREPLPLGAPGLPPPPLSSAAPPGRLDLRRASHAAGPPPR